jgi:hypothetical protein
MPDALLFYANNFLVLIHDHARLLTNWIPGAAGGICEKFMSFRDGYAVKERSLNTGIVTFLNYNRHVPPLVSQLAFAHEVGHNFGAQVDPSNTCKYWYYLGFGVFSGKVNF